MTDLFIFVGRFHPVIVHLPIGFLLMAVILFFWAKNKKDSSLENAISLAINLGAASAFMAVISGLLLANQGDYNPDTLFWHQTGAIVLTILSVGIALIRHGFFNVRKIPGGTMPSLFALVAVLVTVTGHLGGSLTHGSNYLLQYAPAFVKKVFNTGDEMPQRAQVTELDSADIFLDVIQPILASRCQSCHNSDKREGKLLLTSYEQIMEGGENGQVLIPGNPKASELMRRIMLSGNHEEVMPPQGKKQLTLEQKKILGWWIAKGAIPSALLANMDLQQEIVPYLKNVLGLSDDDAMVAADTIKPASADDIDFVRQKGFIVKKISAASNYLEVKVSPKADNIDPQALLQLKEHVQWLDLSHAKLQDEDLQIIGKLKQLTRLYLNNNPLGKGAASHLSGLSNLEYLNIYQTNIDDQGLRMLAQLPQLKKIYCWQTAVTQKTVADLNTVHSGLYINSGYTRDYN